MDKRINLILTAIAAATLLAACSPTTPESSPEDAPGDGAVSAGNAILIPESANPTETTIEHADAVQAKALLDSNVDVVVLDIRTPGEFESGHIPGAKNIDFRADDFGEEIAALDKATPYLVHCGSGGRSTRSLEVFKENGFHRIIHLDGGLNDWKSAGNEVTAD